MKSFQLAALLLPFLASAESFAKPTDPACGIIATTTVCSVTIGEQTWTASATDCDSPIDNLRAQLSESGVVDQKGLQAQCNRSDIHDIFGRDYIITL